jgi:hypothetical protein
MAKITALDVAEQLSGEEHLPIVQGATTKRATMAAFRDLITPFLQYWYKGDRGFTGPANSTYPSMAAIAAADITNLSAIYAPADGAAATTYTWTEGNFTGRSDVIASSTVPIAEGAWVPQGADGIRVDLGTLYASAQDALRGVAKGDLALYSGDIDARIYAAVANGARDLLIPAGEFRMTTAVYALPSHTTIRGAGDGSFDENGASQAKPGTATKIIMDSPAASFAFQRSESLTVENLWLHMVNGDRRGAIYSNYERVVNGTVRRVAVTGDPVTVPFSNSFTFETREGIDGLLLEDVTSVKATRMGIEILNQDYGLVPRPYVWGVELRRPRIILPTFQAISLDGFIFRALIDQAYINGGAHTAFENIEAQDTTILNPRTKNVTGSMVALTNVREMRGFLIKGLRAHSTDPTNPTAHSAVMVFQGSAVAAVVEDCEFAGFVFIQDAKDLQIRRSTIRSRERTIYAQNCAGLSIDGCDLTTASDDVWMPVINLYDSRSTRVSIRENKLRLRGSANGSAPFVRAFDAPTPDILINNTLDRGGPLILDTGAVFHG